MTNLKLDCQPSIIMEIAFKNLAKAGSGSVKIKDLTVIYGENNTGKTHLAYAIYGIFENMLEYFDIGLTDRQIKNTIKELHEKGLAEIDISKHIGNFHRIIENIEEKIVSNFHNFFNMQEEYFPNIKISLLFKNINTNVNITNTFNMDNNIWGDFIHKNGNSKIILRFRKSEFDSNFLESESYVYELRDVINLVIFNNFLRQFCQIPYPVSSERTGISLFHKIFDYNNSKILESLVSNTISHGVYDKIDLLPTHALPIKYDIDIIRFYEDYLMRKSFLFYDSRAYNVLLDCLSELIEGTFSSSNGVIYYHPNKLIHKHIDKIPLTAASSSVKALLLLDVFVKHLAIPNHILIIDEPELNLHPRKQIIMARLIAGLVNAGVKVLITTHSDFIVREISNLVMLNSADKKYKKNVMKNHCFNKCEILDHKRISVYNTTDDLAVQEVEVDRYGINSTMFDDVIIDENKRRNEVSEIMEEENEG